MTWPSARSTDPKTGILASSFLNTQNVGCGRAIASAGESRWLAWVDMNRYPWSGSTRERPRASTVTPSTGMARPEYFFERQRKSLPFRSRVRASQPSSVKGGAATSVSSPMNAHCRRPRIVTKDSLPRSASPRSGKPRAGGTTGTAGCAAGRFDGRDG